MTSRRLWTLHEVEALLRDRGFTVVRHGVGEAAISGVTEDSRAARSGSMFLAWKGTRRDGHDFVTDAVARGASAVLSERRIEGVEVPQIVTSDPRSAGAVVAMALFGEPAHCTWNAGITGTNGKTTTAGLVRHLLAEERATAVIGTLGVVGPEGRVREGTGGLTTPPPVELALRFADLVREGVEAVVLEASSHALEQRRLDGVRFHAAAFTNLTPDHLDYHGTMEAYLEAKSYLLNLLAPNAEVTVFAGDRAWLKLPAIPAAVRAVGIREPAPSDPTVSPALEPPAPLLPAPQGISRSPDLVAESLRLDGTGAQFVLAEGTDRVPVRLPLLGRFNVENALCAAGIARTAGMSLEAIARRLATAEAPKGRLEVTAHEPVPVILDYAHTPDALERALETLRPLYPGRLIVVFGAGGDRDPSKRPLMGQAALRGADVALVTSDNPRTEDPEAIVDDIIRGMAGAPEPIPTPASESARPMTGGARLGRFERIPDRTEAIRRALALAEPGDAILLAGKGHETVQIVGTERRPFDERVIVREILAELRGAS
jgi:UDP-N-acetylmuramoyl-L-alanyl-D-glutamate--2,6-diaminopimelate ligase